MAEPAKVIEFKLPKRRPKVVEKVAPQDQRKFAIVPMRALSDQRLHHQTVRVLALVCSYCNRAGITWVGQARIAEHLGVSKQAVNKAMSQLKAMGYLETVSKGFRGEKADTLRVIYDPEIKTEDAIAVASSKEDSRPPEQIKREAKQMTEPEFTEEQMTANRARLREMLGGLAGRDGNHHYNKLERISDIMARKPRAKPAPKTPDIVNTQVDYAEGLHSQPIVNLQVDQTRKNIGYTCVIGFYEDKYKKKFNTTVRTTEVDCKYAALVCELGLDDDRYLAALEAMTEPKTLADLCDELINA